MITRTHVMHDPTAGELMSLMLPLQYFYAQQDREFPIIEFLDSGEVPEPQFSLLVHDLDMTSTLTRHHGSDLSLNVLYADQSVDYLIRMVVLERMDNRSPVEFGAIGIHLDKLQSEMRSAVVAQEAPFGALLERYEVDFRSSPKGFFRIQSDQLIGDALHNDRDVQLYGRCNELTDREGFVLADIVEILPLSPLKIGK